MARDRTAEIPCSVNDVLAVAIDDLARVAGMFIVLGEVHAALGNPAAVAVSKAQAGNMARLLMGVLCVDHTSEQLSAGAQEIRDRLRARNRDLGREAVEEAERILGTR